MADKFYSFIWNGRAYVGELSGSDSTTSCLEYHFNRALPWAKKKKKGRTDFNKEARGDAALERSLFQFLKQFGGEECIKLLSNIIEVDATNVINLIRTSLDNYVFNNFKNEYCPYNKQTYSAGKFYSDIVEYFGRDDPYAFIKVPEMLLILLRSKDFAMWNTHANYGPRDRYVNGLDNYINAKRLQQREMDTKKKPYIFFTFDIHNLPSEISKKIRGKRSTNKITGHDQKAIDILKNPDFVKKVPKVIKDTTIKSAKKQLQNFINRPSLQKEDWQTEQVRNDAINLIEELDKMKGKRYSSLAKKINDSLSKYEQINFNPTSFKTFDDFANFLLGWLEKTSFSTFIGGGNNDLQDLTSWYKNNFTSYIQDNYLNQEKISDYQEWRNERITNWQGKNPLRPGALYPSFLKKNDPNTLINNQSLKSKIHSSMEDENSFIKNNWDFIYPEQIAYCLTKKGANFNITDNIEIYEGFIDTIELDKINWY